MGRTIGHSVSLMFRILIVIGMWVYQTIFIVKD